LAIGVLVAVGLAFLRSSTPAPRLTLPQAQPGSGPGENRPPVASSAATPRPASTAPASTALSVSPVTVTVHVAGQVTGPGVYVVPAGARAADAIVAAGGTTAEADVEALNLAARVADGERVYVPRRGEIPPPVASRPATLSGPGGSLPAGASGAPIDLNAATAEQLDSLPGVGPATSAAILAYRSSHGRFRSVTELLEVPGIGPAKLEALRPRVRV